LAVWLAGWLEFLFSSVFFLVAFAWFE
jgi:hypothetical protein